MPYRDKEKLAAAKRRWYEKNKEVAKQTVVTLRLKKRQIIKDAKSGPCSDCGVQYPYYVMDFDHLGNKEYTMADTSRIPLAKILDEIAKCELVCSNCHRERTHQRKQGQTSG